jgi:hypothetical protein
MKELGRETAGNQSKLLAAGFEFHYLVDSNILW